MTLPPLRVAKSNIAAPACTGLAVAAANRRRLKIDAAPLGGGLAEHQRGARRRIHLVPMMHLKHFNIEVIIQ